MNSRLFFLPAIVFVFLFQNTFGQNDQWALFAEGNIKEVRLLWNTNHWSDTIRGMNLKRRVNGGKWELLTFTPVVPAMNPKRDFKNVTNDPEVITSLKKKIAANPNDFPASDSTAFLETIKKPGGLALMAYGFARDFDRALITGFGFYDRKIPAVSGTLEYGLFAVNIEGKESSQIAGYKWKIGDKPSYPLQSVVAVTGNKMKNQIHVEWTVNTKSYVNAKVLFGFHIDRIDNGIRKRLTSQPIVPNTIEENFPMFINDKVQDAQHRINYELVPVSVLGYESLPLTALYDPAEVPGNINPKLNTTYKSGDTVIVLNWSIDPANEKFIASYELEQRESIIQYSSLSGALKDKQYIIHYDTARARKTYQFRVKCNLKNNYDAVFSEDLTVEYYPVILPARISGLNAEVVEREGKYYARLTWPAIKGVKGYVIYTKDLSGDGMSMEASIPLIKTQEYLYPFQYQGSREFTFAVAGKDEYGNFGELSNKVTVASPSRLLLSIWFDEYKTIEGNKVALAWSYNEPADLAGYRIYENGKLVADEKTLKKGTMKWASLKKTAGTYNYEIEALTARGIVSPRSTLVTVVIK